MPPHAMPKTKQRTHNGTVSYTHLDAFYPQCPTRRYLCGGNGKNHVLLEYISETAAEPEPVADIIALLN